MSEGQNTVKVKDIGNFSLLYQENAKIVAIFWEWRNKIITYFFTAIGALFVLAGWLYQQNFGRWVFIPFLLGALLSFFSLRLERRNAGILKNCYRVGEILESKLDAGEGAIFTAINKAHGHPKRVTYTRTLRYTYVAVAALLLAISALILYKPIYPSPAVTPASFYPPPMVTPTP